jgi:hypothetical protein
MIIRISPDLVQGVEPNQRNRTDSCIRCDLNRTLVVTYLHAEQAVIRSRFLTNERPWNGQVYTLCPAQNPCGYVPTERSFDSVIWTI